MAGMTLRETANDPLVAAPEARARPPVDLAHLRAQTMGDRGLEEEVLRLFLRRSAECLDRIRAAGNIAARRAAAHALVGSARGVGAFPVAEIAREIEIADAAVAGRLSALDRAIAAARRFIADHLAE